MRRPYRLMLIALMFAPQLASAQITIEQYRQARLAKDQSSLQIYIAGVVDGIYWANIALKSERARPLYCMPDGLAFNSDNAIYLIDSTLKKPNNKFVSSDTPIGIVLLQAIKDEFPCKT